MNVEDTNDHTRSVETYEERELRLANRRNQRKKKRAEETEEERKIRIEYERSQRQNKLNAETPEEREERLARDRNRKKKIDTKTIEEREVRLEHRRIQWSKKKAEANNEPIVESGQLSESDRNLLNTFRKIMAKTKSEFCLTCDERFPSIILYQGECYRCYRDKNTPKKFSTENNMNL
ncbi:5876_t:CDS:1, partial [Dentiscutata erythropus]